MTTNPSKRNRSLNFFLNDEQADSRVFGNSDIDVNKNYLILQNDVLQKKCYDLEKEKNEIQKSSDEFEIESEKFDESSRYIKNEMKNFIELRNMAEKISILCDKKGDKAHKHSMEIFKLFKTYMQLLLLLRISGSLVYSCIFYYMKVSPIFLYYIELINLSTAFSYTFFQ